MGPDLCPCPFHEPDGPVVVAFQAPLRTIDRSFANCPVNEQPNPPALLSVTHNYSAS